MNIRVIVSLLLITTKRVTTFNFRSQSMVPYEGTILLTLLTTSLFMVHVVWYLPATKGKKAIG